MRRLPAAFGFAALGFLSECLDEVFADFVTSAHLERFGWAHCPCFARVLFLWINLVESQHQRVVAQLR